MCNAGRFIDPYESYGGYMGAWMDEVFQHELEIMFDDPDKPSEGHVSPERYEQFMKDFLGEENAKEFL